MFLHCVLRSFFLVDYCKTEGCIWNYCEVLVKLIDCNKQSQWSKCGGLSSVITTWCNCLIGFTEAVTVCFCWFNMQLLFCFIFSSILVVKIVMSPGLQHRILERKFKSTVLFTCNCKITDCCLVSLVLMSLRIIALESYVC